MARVPHVALLIETSREYARGLLRGVARYYHEHGPWSVYHVPHGLGDPPPGWIQDWEGDGILARINDQRTADIIKATTLPVVDVRGAIRDAGLPIVAVDNAPIARFAFDHLYDCGLRRFAFVGLPRGKNPCDDRRCDCFVEEVERKGLDCEIFSPEPSKSESVAWEEEQTRIADWLTGLSKPIGIVTSHDEQGHQVLDACRRANLSVPDEVAVVGVDNDPHLCNLCTPPLSSVDVNSERIGYEAAVLLTRLMNGEPRPDAPIFIGSPRGVIGRRSTDSLFVEDGEIASAVRFIRDNAFSGLRVRDVVERASYSPSTIERRFRKALGRTIKKEIDRVRLSRAKLLLAETDHTVENISRQCGFSEAKYFCEVFRKHEGITATEYRRKFRSTA